MKKIWQIGWRVALCAVLLLWIFHCIFVNEARIAHPGQWSDFPRPEQWRLGWREGPPALWQTLTSVHSGWFLLSLVLMGSTILLGILRWRMVLRVQGLDLPLSRHAVGTLGHVQDQVRLRNAPALGEPRRSRQVGSITFRTTVVDPAT